jgi:endo-1,4-beta-xylanase
MKIIYFYKVTLSIGLSLIFGVLTIQKSSSQTFCIQAGADQITGNKDGYRYELWNQNSQGSACMKLGVGAKFSGTWSGIENYLSRRGLGYNQTLEHQQIGTFYATYNCNYNPSSSSGNSYLSVYGWTVNPLVEYYIIEDWRNWIPSMSGGATLKGSFTANGSSYDIYENTRVNQPSILGNTTFQQYFSIRRNVRNSGTINISEHFNKWESLGMNMGKMHEVSFVVEGYKNNGNFEFTNLDVFTSNNPVNVTDVVTDTKLVSIYPNPNTGNVTIKLEESALNGTLLIYNALGEIIFSQESINSNVLQLSYLKSGCYFIQVTNNKMNHTSKLVVL